MESNKKQIHIKNFLYLEADTASAKIPALGWDTEQTGRETICFLKSPVELVLEKDGVRINPQVNFISANENAFEYELTFAKNIVLVWKTSVSDKGINMQFSCNGDLKRIADRMELVFPFDPTVAVASVISSNWDKDAKFQLPAIISIPDIGQMLVGSEMQPDIVGRCNGSRTDKWITVVIELPVINQDGAFELTFVKTILALPKGFPDEKSWKLGRRGWFNFIQLSCGASGGTKDVAGVWANNTLSDPVSSLVYMLGDCTLLVPELAPGVSMAPILRKTIEYWLDNGTSWDGNIAYTAANAAGFERYHPRNRLTKDPAKQINHAYLMDTNPSILIAAWCYVKGSNDIAWLKERMEHLEFLSDYMEARDVDNDGLIESIQSGNAGSRPPRSPDTAWDCYCSGHKNAIVNILAFRAWKCLADLENLLGNHDKGKYYQEKCNQMKDPFMKELYNPVSGWMGSWRSLDGVLHDINTDSPTSFAIDYGLIEKEQGKQMLQKYWTALQETGFNRFDLGVPLNIKPVPKEEMEHYFEFQHFLNGGCGITNTGLLLNAMYIVGMDKEADMILSKMLQRQWEGCFPNGGGFQNGFVDRMGEGAEVYDWNGKPEGYEGHLVYCWGFLHSMLLKEQSMRKLVYESIR